MSGPLLSKSLGAGALDALAFDKLPDQMHGVVRIENIPKRCSLLHNLLFKVRPLANLAVRPLPLPQDQ